MAIYTIIIIVERRTNKTKGVKFVLKGAIGHFAPLQLHQWMSSRSINISFDKIPIIYGLLKSSKFLQEILTINFFFFESIVIFDKNCQIWYF